MIYKDDEYEYTYRGGEPVEILTTERDSLTFPVVSITRAGGLIRFHTKTGASNVSFSTPYDLILVPEHDYPIDANVWVWVWSNEVKKYKRHFAGTDPRSGRPMAWDAGRTKWTSEGNPICWDYCKLAE